MERYLILCCPSAFTVSRFLRHLPCREASPSLFSFSHNRTPKMQEQGMGVTPALLTCECVIGHQAAGVGGNGNVHGADDLGEGNLRGLQEALLHKAAH